MRYNQFVLMECFHNYFRQDMEIWLPEANLEETKWYNLL
jgi:hypothetical protein